MRARAAWVIASLIASACTSVSSVTDKIRPRAAFDLNCPKDQVQIVLLDGDSGHGTYGATGCGQRVRYEATCGINDVCDIKAAVVTTEPAR